MNDYGNLKTSALGRTFAALEEDKISDSNKRIDSLAEQCEVECSPDKVQDTLVSKDKYLLKGMCCVVAATVLIQLVFTIICIESDSYYDFWRDNTFIFIWFFIVSVSFALYTHLYYKTIEEAEKEFSAFLLIAYCVSMMLLCNGGGGEYNSSTAFVVPLFSSFISIALTVVVILKRDYGSVVSYVLLVIAIGASFGVSYSADSRNFLLSILSAVVGMFYFIWALFELSAFINGVYGNYAMRKNNAWLLALSIATGAQVLPVAILVLIYKWKRKKKFSLIRDESTTVKEKDNLPTKKSP